MTSAPIAIVIPVYNRAEIVGRTLQSLLEQSFRPMRVVLVDNNSSDGTLAVLRDWAADVSTDDFVVDVITCATPGAAAARNAGLKIVEEPWTLFFDSDDIMPQNHIANVMNHIAQADMVGWNVNIIVDEKERRLPFVGKGSEMYDNLFHGGMSTQRYCAKTSLFRQVGAWNEAVRYWDDIELGARLLAQKPRIVHMGDSGIKIYVSAESITSSAFGNPQISLPALIAIETTLAGILGKRRARVQCQIKLAIECGIADSNGARVGLNLLKEQGAVSIFARWAYYYTRLGFRGAARLLKLIGAL